MISKVIGRVSTPVVKNVVKNVVNGVAQSTVIVDQGIPANVLRNDDGTPVRNEDGSYIYTA